MNKLVASVVLVSLISLAGMKCFGDNEKELGYLGVMTRSVDPALAGRLGLAEGMGRVIIDTVDEDTAFELQVDDQAKHLVIRGEDNKTGFDGNIDTDEEWKKSQKSIAIKCVSCVKWSASN